MRKNIRKRVDGKDLEDWNGGGNEGLREAEEKMKKEMRIKVGMR